MLKVLLTCYTKSATKAPLLSDPMLVGNPNLGTHSLSRHQATFNALSVLLEKSFYASRECTYYDQQGMTISVNSTSRCSKGRVLFSWYPGAFCLCREAVLICEQAVQFWDVVLNREERRATKKYFQISSPSLSWPRWVPWCVWLTRVGVSTSGANNLPLCNSHHPFSFLMTPSALASGFWASVYFGESSSGSSANMRALIGFHLSRPRPRLLV